LERERGNDWKYKNKDRDYKDNEKLTWAKELKWEILPGVVCLACKTNNHNVYTTGCPTLAEFSACKEFYDATPKSKVEPVKQAYQIYLSTICKKMRNSRFETYRTLCQLTVTYDEDEIDDLHNTLFESYKEEYPEDQYCDNNPFNNLDMESDEESSQE
jgi:hypothetical protein